MPDVASAKREPPEWLTVQEVASACQVARSTVYRWIKDGSLPVHGEVRRGRGSGMRVRWDELVQFISNPPPRRR